ncbi:MAG: UdgX family uracil-DNA binding protein [Sulfitobacter sp.]
MQHVVIPDIHAATIWRDRARGFLAAGTPPHEILWGDTTSAADLFATPAPAVPPSTVKVPRSFVAMANTVAWHSDPERFARLYAFLWRLREAPYLMTDRGDADLARLRQMEKNVRRCQHKMKAFVRFREITLQGANRRSFAAWFEPTHNTVEPTADFFAGRFADMDWRILTPKASAIFEGGQLSFESGQVKPDLPNDASEDLWITYFRNIFNPARLKVQAMQSEMPKKYWKNMPEAAAIPDLIANAPARARKMALAAPSLPPRHMANAQAQLASCASAWEGPDAALPIEINACTRCPLHQCATQAVLGEGPMDAALMIVGEQPGDQEDLKGRPFIGPAGKVFDRVAKTAALDRRTVYVTNAVKHFKFSPRGRRRIHQRPNTSEIEHCKWWLNAELAQVKPKLVVALGATAAQALTGNGSSVMARRGKIEQAQDGPPVLITIHPSYVLRQPEGDARQKAENLLLHDLKAALREIGG